ncbi:indole-3-glycerol phosphate synthase TrpC [Erythrobacteraceae bacterium CFH 75059]|uniref:indole-3-glycerol phosphate synthase TrpC n=1 Tax=Qipengyuania thermophila TaxID=2509361 RepID=UPI00101FCCCD|nr:indole-3-glycerol phosphate synthase TrpC [Qipengyuania thermophila]TCD05277.1 indole-3-glycerol phosphate synthase TrpC [Erythrobacteraceae bacterium CFH 75059]
MNMLREICATKREEVVQARARQPYGELARRCADADPPRGFARRLRAAAQDGYGLIAEIKHKSPSKGVIRERFDPAAHAREYERGGAACLSVLTDRSYFGGADDHLRGARAACGLPVLRKDFLVDPWQVAQSRALGADAVLIIVAALDQTTMHEIEDAAEEHGMDVLVEVHDADELARALDLRSPLIGVNNRDLRTFKTDLCVTERLAPLVPSTRTVVAESGIDAHTDLKRLENAGVRTFLVGEALMRQADLAAATTRLLRG